MVLLLSMAALRTLPIRTPHRPQRGERAAAAARYDERREPAHAGRSQPAVRMLGLGATDLVRVWARVRVRVRVQTLSLP